MAEGFGGIGLVGISGSHPHRHWTYSNAHLSVPMSPMTQPEGHDAAGLIDELVPGEAAVVDDVVVGFEDAVRQHDVVLDFSRPGKPTDNVSASDFVRWAKGRSSRKLQQEIEHIRKRCWGQRFWQRGYFSTTSGNITDDIIMRYLDCHTHKDGFSPSA